MDSLYQVYGSSIRSWNEHNRTNEFRFRLRKSRKALRACGVSSYGRHCPLCSVSCTGVFFAGCSLNAAVMAEAGRQPNTRPRQLCGPTIAVAFKERYLDRVQSVSTRQKQAHVYKNQSVGDSGSVRGGSEKPTLNKRAEIALLDTFAADTAVRGRGDSAKGLGFRKAKYEKERA